MPDANGKFKGISVGVVPWHNATDAILPSDEVLNPDEVVEYVDPVQEVAAVLVGRNVMRVYRSHGGLAIETSDSCVLVEPDAHGELSIHVTEL